MSPEADVSNDTQTGLVLEDGFSRNSPSGLLTPFAAVYFPTARDLPASMSSRAISTNIDFYHLLSQVVYLVSNNLVPKDIKKDAGGLDIVVKVMTRVPNHILVSIFNHDEPSIQATWEKLFEVARKHSLERGLAQLLCIGLTIQADWVPQYHEEMLIVAVSLDKHLMIQTLLDRGVSPCIWDATSRRTVFAIAASREDLHSVKMLIGKCDPHKLNEAMITFHTQFSEGICSVFVLFMIDLWRLSQTIDSRSDKLTSNALSAYLRTLDWLLDAGADVDSVVSSDLVANARPSWRLTCLDLAYYSHRTIFERVKEHSQQMNRELTRAGLCEAFINGEATMSRYLSSVSSLTTLKARHCLEAILADQFLMIDESKDPKHSVLAMTPNQISIARALIQGAVSPHCGGTLERALERVVKAAVQWGMDEDLAYLIEYFTREGALVSLDALMCCLQSTGCEILDTLLLHAPDVDDCETALLVAADRDNYEAVSLLLRSGVDINRDCCPPSSSRLRAGNYRFDFLIQDCTILGHLMTNPRQGNSEKRQAMWAYLVGRGARLRLRQSHTSCYRLLYNIILNYRKSSFKNFRWDAFHFVLQHENKLSPSQWRSLLALSTQSYKSDWRIIQTIIEQCNTFDEPILAAAITSGCDMHVVNNLVRHGQSIHDFSGGRTPLQAAAERLDLDIMFYLIQRGANVNAPGEPGRIPIGRETGGTALQRVCAYQAESSDELNRKRRIIEFLTHHHEADVNAPALSSGDSTALHLLVGSIDQSKTSVVEALELCSLLLEQGANVNGAPGFEGKTALQSSAEKGIMEMTLFFTMHGADPNIHPVWEVGVANEGRNYRGFSGRWCTALDLATYHGRLDMTQFLLEIGAVSGHSGATGYQGASDLALEKGHQAVIDVIRRHVEKTTKLHLQDPDRRSAHESAIQDCISGLKIRAEECKQLGWKNEYSQALEFIGSRG